MRARAEVSELTGDAERVVVRRRWNGADTATVAAGSLSDLHVRDEPGGVCGALPRGFLYGRVWCDKVPVGWLGHSCREESRPHELLVCVLPNDNPQDLHERLRARTRR